MRGAFLNTFRLSEPFQDWDLAIEFDKFDGNAAFGLCYAPMRHGLFALILTLLCPLATNAQHQHKETIDSTEGLHRLLEGNQRFAEGHAHHPNQTEARREKVARGQNPFAVVLTCADSRLAPEFIFDQGIGDLFVLRVAGNTANGAMIGSMEYAVEHLGARLIMVLGHSKCGAVDAAIEGGEAPGSLPDVINPILPAVEAARRKSGDLLMNAIKENAKFVARSVRNASPLIAEFESKGLLRIVYGYYDVASGKVTLSKSAR